MTDRFDYFIVFAEMRTGSNFLESNLNAIDGLTCHGEAFNPHFIAYPKKTEILGITQDMRDTSPQRLITAIRNEPGTLGGFRFFHGHDPRVLDIALEDPRCAKIILTRNPLDSYISWKIAKATGQWKLTDIKRRKDAQARFDGPEFTQYVEDLQGFQVLLLNRLQISGQAPFYVAYEDLQSLEIMNGLAKWLGVNGQLEGLDKSLKRQNPSPITEKVSNPTEMTEALPRLDRFNLNRTPNFEPRRGPTVPSYVVGVKTPLMYLPISGGPENAVVSWLAGLDNVDVEGLQTKLNQKQLRQWKRRNRVHRSFTVLRHPLARCHATFCQNILSTGPHSFGQIRNTLRKRYKLPIPGGEPTSGYTRADHQKAFKAFLVFVKANLAGQTAIRVDGAWSTQFAALSGFGDFNLPDYVLREDEMSVMLVHLARQVGHNAPMAPDAATPDWPYTLSEIYDDELEELAASVYQRDYLMFGFGPWAKS
ncbi:MAG: nodulation protein NodH [Rhodobacteraceae bacterium]|nr:nodulation protein NodH [Paracoccaceae bacterium]